MKNISEKLIESYLEFPERNAITLLSPQKAPHVITYLTLVLYSYCYVKQLTNAGVNPNDVVIIILPHSESLVYAFFGSVLHGAIPSIMPFLTEKLSPEHYRQSLISLFQITKPKAVITHENFRKEVEKASSYAPSVQSILIAENISPPDYVETQALRGICRTPDQLVLLQHSSGTTGLQKGVALSNKAISNQINSYSDAINLQQGGTDVIISWLPLYHDMGLIAGFILPVLHRNHLVLMSPFDWVKAPWRLFQAIDQYKGTLTWLPNFAYNFCAQKIRDRDIVGIDLSTMRAIINCSEPMIWESHQMFLNRFQSYGLKESALATCYAMAENVFAVTQDGIQKSVTIDKINRSSLSVDKYAQPQNSTENSLYMLSAGTPIRNTNIKILDPERETLPERFVGEIAIFSDCMLSEYYKRNDLTEKAFHEGWFLTGDLGYIADNELYITGRKKDLIIVGGKNIFPQDIERIAGEIPGIHPGRVSAFGVLNPKTGTEDVILVAEIDEGDDNKLDYIADQIRIKITQATDVSLRYVKLVNRGWLLKTSSGKVARSANREKYINEFCTPT